VGSFSDIRLGEQQGRGRRHRRLIDVSRQYHPMHAIARHIPLGRVGLPDEVVNAAVFLAFGHHARHTRQHHSIVKISRTPRPWTRPAARSELHLGHDCGPVGHSRAGRS
jgi:hypothetical protein